ncbi:MAG: glycosyltransferase family 9 protein [bacterium]
MNKAKKKNIKKVCFIIGGGIGNIITFTPVLKKLNKELPQTQITILGNNIKVATEILETYPCDIKKIELSPKMSFYGILNILNDIRKEKFDLMILPSYPFRHRRAYQSIIKSSLFAVFSGAKYIIGDKRAPLSFLFYNIRIIPKGRNIVELNLSILEQLGFTLNKEDAKPELFFNFVEADKKMNSWIKQYDLTTKKLIVFHIGSGKGYYNRRWANDKWAELGDILIDKYKVSISFIGNKLESMEVQKIQNLMKQKTFNLAGELSLCETAKLIKISNLVVCTNSGPMHIAATLEVPSVVLMGPTLKEWWPSYSRTSIIVWKNKCNILCEGPCRRKENVCMTSITVKDVLKVIALQLKNKNE